jgi:hypothetical protein
LTVSAVVHFVVVFAACDACHDGLGAFRCVVCDQAAAAADEDEAPLPYEEPATEDGDTDEPDWHNTDTNADPDYEPFDGEFIVSCCLWRML